MKPIWLRFSLLMGAVGILFFTSRALPQVPKTLATAPLVRALVLKRPSNGVTISRSGRIFLVFISAPGASGIHLAEWVRGSAVSYPSAAWNSWSVGKDAGDAFVNANALRIGPEGDLWVVDTGAVFGFGPADTLHGGPKLVRINLQENRAVRVYSLDSAAPPGTFVDDVRFNEDLAYLSDAGLGAIIVLDLKTGKTRRVLEGDQSTVAQTQLSADGQLLTDPAGKPVRFNADQLEVSKDGAWLFYQTASGPMYRIETKFLNADVSEEERRSHVALWAKTGATGGSAIDSDGCIYVSDLNRRSILRISADGIISTLIEDPRLRWVDAMWIDDRGYLWAPAAQLNRTAYFNHGTSGVEQPIEVFKLRIDRQPVRR
jgi:sugar lactone lactonase YvrE